MSFFRFNKARCIQLFIVMAIMVILVILMILVIVVQQGQVNTINHKKSCMANLMILVIQVFTQDMVSIIFDRRNGESGDFLGYCN